LGEDIVLFRDGGKVYALSERCPHRGARLSQGKCLYPGSGTISCRYHGWTFKGETGRCVAKLMGVPMRPWRVTRR
jgi:phenylpropionate dioxygenase-like ring-hydroxylating dioxygenase large terminal subunit